MTAEHDPQKAGEAPNSSPQPLLSLDKWAPLDDEHSDNGSSAPDYPGQISSTGVVGRFWKVDLEQPSDMRVRIERPVLFFWLLISCFWQGFIPWVVMGLALITYALVARPAFRQYSLTLQPWVYCGMGLGQIMVACNFITNLGPFWPFIGVYWLAVLLTWLTIEFRRMRIT